MTITNHVVTGVLVATIVDNPLIGIPMAFLSHFVVDVLPHFGYKQSGFGNYFQHKLSYLVIIVDLFATLALLVFTWPQPWWVYVAGFAGVAPDLAWPYRYWFFERTGKAKPGEGNIINRFHNNIQWCERPWGIFFELFWLLLTGSILISVS